MFKFVVGLLALGAMAIDAKCVTSSRSVKLTETVTSGDEFNKDTQQESIVGIFQELTPWNGQEDAIATPLATRRKDLMNLVNVERASRNLTKVCLNSKLSLAAQRHATDMANKNYFSHVSLDGTRFYQRIAATGFSAGWSGEIIAAGQTSAASVMKAWMNSPGHKAIILGPNYTRLGGGYAYSGKSTYKHYWVQEFASTTSTNDRCDA